MVEPVKAGALQGRERLCIYKILSSEIIERRPGETTYHRDKSPAV